MSTAPRYDKGRRISDTPTLQRVRSTFTVSSPQSRNGTPPKAESRFVDRNKLVFSSRLGGTLKEGEYEGGSIQSDDVFMLNSGSTHPPTGGYAPQHTVRWLPLLSTDFDGQPPDARTALSYRSQTWHRNGEGRPTLSIAEKRDLDDLTGVNVPISDWVPTAYGLSTEERVIWYELKVKHDYLEQHPSVSQQTRMESRDDLARYEYAIRQKSLTAAYGCGEDPRLIVGTMYGTCTTQSNPIGSGGHRSAPKVSTGLEWADIIQNRVHERFPEHLVTNVASSAFRGNACLPPNALGAQSDSGYGGSIGSASNADCPNLHAFVDPHTAFGSATDDIYRSLDQHSPGEDAGVWTGLGGQFADPWADPGWSTYSEMNGWR